MNPETMDIEIIRIADPEAWSDKLNDYKYSLFITTVWIESLKDTGREPIYLDFISNNQLIAKIGGFSIRSGFFWQRKLFFYAGPALRNNLPDDTAEQCIIALIRFAKTSKYPRLVILSYDYRYVLPGSKDFGFSVRSEFLFDLQQDSDQISKSISREVKRRTRFAQKNDFTIRVTTSPDMCSQLVNLMQSTKRIRLAKGYADYNYFYFPYFTQKSLEQLANSGAIRFYAVERDNILYAVCAVFTCNLKAYAMFVGLQPEGYRNGAPSFIDQHMIYSLKAQQYEYINFGGIPLDQSHQGLVRFKKAIGTVEYASSYGSTNFLIFPYCLFNPALKRIRDLPERTLINKLKKFLKI